MKNRGVIMAVIIAIALMAVFFLPNKKSYRTLAVVGKPVQDFTLNDSAGKSWKLSDLKGKVVFINFWATWCVTCKAEQADKTKLYKMMQGKPFQMLGVLFRDDPKNLPGYIKKIKVSAPTLVDPKNDLSQLYGITGVPETFILDKEGILRERLVGPQAWGDTDMVALIEKWL
jgi:peroxiredoxin